MPTTIAGTTSAGPVAGYYGTVTEVAALRPRYTASGIFTSGTNPTSAAVLLFLQRASAIIDVMLARQGFTVPITAASVVLMLDQLAIGFAVDLCDIANSAGRFYDEKSRPGNPQIVMMNEIQKWVEDNAPGIERMGAVRVYSVTAGLLYRDTDESGDDSAIPLFPIDSFGVGRKDWDSSE